MDLGQLRSFAEVAERGTIAAAAEARGYTAPAISQHVAKLEAQIKVPLFDRAGGRLQLNSAGAALLPLALELLDLEQVARTTAQEWQATPHFRIAGFASAISTLIVPRLDELAGQLTLEIIEAEDSEAMRDLRLGHVDVVLTQEYCNTPTERDGRLDYTSLATDQLKLVLPADMASSTTVGDLAHSAWLINGSGTRCAQATRHILDQAQIDPPIGASIADNQTLLALVAAGHGVTVVPELLLGSVRSTIAVADQDLAVQRTILAVNRKAAAKAVAPLIDRLC